MRTDETPLNFGRDPLPNGVLPPHCFRPGKENIPDLRYWDAPITRISAHECIRAHFRNAIHEIEKRTPGGRTTTGWKLAGGLEEVLSRLMVPDVNMSWVRCCVNGQHRRVYHLIETLHALYRVLEPNRDAPKKRKAKPEQVKVRWGDRFLLVPYKEKKMYPKYLREFT